MFKKFLIAIALFLCASLAHSDTLPLPGGEQSSAINDNFAYLRASKLDLKPGTIVPRLDSAYNLGASGKEWAKLFVDTITVSVISASSISVTTELNFASLNVKSLLQTLCAYRRPVLVFVDTNTVDVENNTGTANQTTLVFPDGTTRSVTEATSSAALYRRLIFSSTASFTSGSEVGGIRSSVSRTANTWYAVYGVKSQINAANFVIVGDTVTPSQANYATLNTNFGTSGWVYLGLIRYGDNANAGSVILSFDQTGHFTKFRTNTSAGNENMPGLRLATSTSGTTLTYTYASGTGAAQIPSNIPIVLIGSFIYTTAGTNTILVEDSGGNRRYIVRDGIVNNFTDQFVANASEGVKNTSTQTIVFSSIMLEGFFDNVLGVGANPNL